MGEYADYILNGDDCQECGQYIGDGDGFPQSCPDCSSPKTHSNKEDFIAIRKGGDLDKLHEFLKDRKYNFVKKCKKDRKGQPMIGLMIRAKRKVSRKGLIVCSNDELFISAVEIVTQYKQED